MRLDEPLDSVGESEILPDPEGLLAAVSSLGYSMEDAFADLVDNSIDAGAKAVRIRILRQNGRLRSVVIADDGEGMTEAALDAAMGFGVRSTHTGPRLGKYGLGLKAASFSQCAQLSVMSRRRRGRAAARIWTAEGISRGWRCHRASPRDASAYLDLDWLDGTRVQTVVRWDDLVAFRIPAARSESMIAALFDATDRHLGLHLHRFIRSGLKITLDTFDVEAEDSSVPRPVHALDPFAYPGTGARGYPKTFKVSIPAVGQFAVEAHIWPTGIRPPQLMLGRGQLANRQGLYFYRNGRIIQAGGWNGVRADGEPHLSLARARIDLQAKHDQAFGLNVRKAGVNVPEGFADAILGATTVGSSFRDYIAAAQRVYRKKQSAPPRPSNFVLGAGVPSKVRGESRRGLKKPQTEVTFTWAKLPADVFFKLDRDTYRIILNARYRQSVMHGRRGSAADAALVKTLLFLRLRDDLGMERIWAERTRELEGLQRLLITAAKAQMP
ncbi:MAG: ATP-binding protein [Solirubrobacteraceae bacterium]